MKEKKLQLKVYGRLLIACVFAGLYAWGGIENKWLRRFIAPLIVQMPFQFLSLSVGYGGDELAIKLLRRFLFALSNSISFLPHYFCWKDKKWIASTFHIIILISAYLILGVFNPLPARVEETILGLLIILLPLMLIHFKKEA